MEEICGYLYVAVTFVVQCVKILVEYPFFQFSFHVLVMGVYLNNKIRIRIIFMNLAPPFATLIFTHLHF